jgi:hypothetical protein
VHRRKRLIYAAAVVGGLAVAGVVAAVGPSLWGEAPTPAGKGKGDSPTRFVPTGEIEALFDGKNTQAWIGPGWGIFDDDGNPVLTGNGSVTRLLPRRPHFRAQFGLNLHEATAVDVVVAVGEGPPEMATRWVLRITRKDGAVFGRRAGGEYGKFEPLADPIPFPTETELKDKVPYQNVRIEKAGDKIRVAFRERPAGEIGNDGRVTVTAIRLVIDGGPVRIESPTVEDLIEQK